ncbi:unnamed protein product [Parascedosporium putredinis]|uniref:Transcriptional repressor Tup1 N-terminal domain-containing protein n=1 Tax=Parascedosporium putredinis TaxID=1442378 RepID=A0A9P1GWY2_9PEZI|nr:unnamed protein product [Parascedosporium putredinis]CAI7988559.1 unnamed protein product [Parascedosporium putredinis]
MYPHNPRMGPPNARLNELLDQIRSEFDTHIRASETYEHQINAQVNEMQLVREKVYAMEQTHMTLKQKYEEEIQMLRRQLDAARGGAPQGGMSAHPQHPGPSQQPPAIAPGNGLFNGIMTGAGQAGLAPLQPQHSLSRWGPMARLDRARLPQAACPYPLPLLVLLSNLRSSRVTPKALGLMASALNLPKAPHPLDLVAVALGDPRRRRPRHPQINTPIPYPGATQSPQVSHHTPADRPQSMNHHAQPGSVLSELNIDQIPAHYKKAGDDWICVFNQHVPRVLDIDLVHTLQHQSVVCCVRFSHDGKYVATGCNRSAQIYDVQTGEKLCVLQDDSADMGGDLYIRSVCFSPDGRYLATGAEDKLIRVWDIHQKQIRNTFSGTHILTLTIEDGVTTVAISPDTKYVAAGSLDKSVRVWDLHQGYLLERLEGPDGHKDSVYSVAFSPNGKDLVSGSLDKTIKMWELSTPRGLPNGPKGGRCVKTFEGHKDFVLSVALTPDNQWVMSGSKDRGVQFWDPRTGATQLMLQGHKNSVISVAPSPTVGYFATGSGDMKARIWSYRPLP